jgi:hypothetical protein
MSAYACIQDANEVPSRAAKEKCSPKEEPSREEQRSMNWDRNSEHLGTTQEMNEPRESRGVRLEKPV